MWDLLWTLPKLLVLLVLIGVDKTGNLEREISWCSLTVTFLCFPCHRPGPSCP